MFMCAWDMMQTNVFFPFSSRFFIGHCRVSTISLPDSTTHDHIDACVHVVGGQGDACGHAVNGGCMCAGGGVHVVDRGMHVVDRGDACAHVVDGGCMCACGGGMHVWGCAMCMRWGDACMGVCNVHAVDRGMHAVDRVDACGGRMCACGPPFRVGLAPRD